MSPLPGPAWQVSGPGRSETNSSQRPSIGVGQKSLAAELTGAPRLTGAPKGSSFEARSDAQMSLPPSAPSPARVLAMYRLRPSGDSIGQPSADGLLTSMTSVATSQAEKRGLSFLLFLLFLLFLSAAATWARARSETAASAYTIECADFMLFSVPGFPGLFGQEAAHPGRPPGRRHERTAK